MAEMQRQQQYLNVPIFYPQRFIRTPAGKVVADRSYNTRAMTEAYLKFQGPNASMPGVEYDWDPARPGTLTLRMPSGDAITTVVTNRIQNSPASNRLDTVERTQTFKETDQGPQGKAFQTVTKWLWKDPETLAGPATEDLQLIATQQVTEYLSLYADVVQVIKTLGGPVAVSNYRVALKRLADGDTPQSGPSQKIPP
eukprot:TRINITY_DN1615_c0_g1_i2.p2 TRINITY_DN1615_c0_g1~~TRINITY_DN1615_c0_g1_i2.p2  ORF type:complete len:197 (-),score=39.97 TRINITY_DN1615_c0_g1_i2:61-651(-)